MFEKLLLNVPDFARLSDFQGAWFMDPRACESLKLLIVSTDLVAHAKAWRDDDSNGDDEDGPPKPKSALEKFPGRSGKSIAVIKVTGTMMKASSSFGGASTVQLRRDVRQAASDEDVSGILLAIDSPGGTVAGTYDLAQEVKAAAKRKPVFAHIDDLGASAAYWIASQCHEIYANAPTAQIGSIGTYAVVYDLSGAAEKQGIKTFLFATGPLKGAGVEGVAITEEQAADWQAMVDEMQKSFDAGVKAGRKLNDKQLADVRTGGVFLAEAAIQKKLIDGIRSYEQTFEALSAAGAKHDRERRATAIDFPIQKGSLVALPTGFTILQVEKNMTFKQWLAARGINPEDLSAEQLAALEGDYKALANPQTAAAETVAEIRRQTAAESKRVADIKAACKGQHDEIEQKAIAEGWDLNRTKAELLDAVRAARPNPAIISRSHDTDCTREALVGAYILRAGGTLDHKAYQSPRAVAMKVPAWLRAGLNSDQRQRAMEFAHRYSTMSMMDLLRQSVRLDGKDVPHDREELFRAAFSGGSLTNIFTDSVNARLLVSYMESGDTTSWCSETDVADLKTNERPRVEIGPGLTLMPEGAEEADHASYADVLESYKINRFARQFVIDEIAFINDSMQVFAETPQKFGQAAGRLRPDLVYSIILDNPTLNATSRDLFNSTDGNLGTTSALSSTTLKAAVSAMMLIQENDVNIDVTPTDLIVPPSLRHLAGELINSSEIRVSYGADDETQVERGTMNALRDDNLGRITEKRLENGVVDPVSGTTHSGSATSWYLIDRNGNTIEVAYLAGTGRSPQVRSGVLTQGKFGLWFDVRHFVGAKALDWRRMRKTTA